MMINSKRKIKQPEKKTIAAASAFQANENASSISPPEMFATHQQTSQPTNEINNNQEQNAPEIDEENTNSQENYATINPGKLMAATRYGHDIFKASAVLQGVNIQGPTALGNPGCLHAPNIESYIYSQLVSEVEGPAEQKLARAVSKVMGNHLDMWRSGFVIPGLYWYPAFSFFPGPVAPPMPNVPTPLQNCPSFGEYLITHEQQIFMEIMSELPSDLDNDVNRGTVQTFSSLASSYFQNWLSTDFITGVLGMGHVPSFSPPFQLGGPVMGHIMPTPGVLS